MMKRALVVLLPALLVFSWLVSACVRIDPPDLFSCSIDSDCQAAEKCADFTCRPKEWCQSDSYCAAGQICEGEKCAPAQCAERQDPVCGGFECGSGRCPTVCYSDGSCRAGFQCSAGTCVAKVPLANGGPCMLHEDCKSAACCQSGASRVCAASCATGGACLSPLDCASGYCCSTSAGSICSATPCTLQPECMTDLACGGGKVCKDQKCFFKQSAGAACAQPTECTSGSCADGKCRGTAGAGDTCLVDTDCERSRVCCVNPNASFDVTCSELGRGCPGSIGDNCEFASDCLGDNCVQGAFCSKSCTTNADCGVSPWGVPNACETNGLGQKICFPGCSNDQQCQENLRDSSLSCLAALDSAGRICAAE